jgi:hypothetical protein
VPIDSLIGIRPAFSFGGGGMSTFPNRWRIYFPARRFDTRECHSLDRRAALPFRLQRL